MRARPADAQQLAAAQLRRLLAEPGSYRRSWQRHAVRSRGGEINQAAVAHVLALYLWEVGERDEHSNLPRELKDRVARALRGEVLSPATLRLFIEAFAITDPEAGNLWSLLGAAAPATDAAVIEPAGAMFRSVALHEFRRIGRDGAPLDQRVVQVIQASGPRLRRYSHFFDTPVTSVRLVRGGRLDEVVSVSAGVSRVDVELARELPFGDTASLEYVVCFQEGAAAPEFRRTASTSVHNLELWVQFDPARVPAQVAWTTWRAEDGAVARAEQVRLDAENVVHRYLTRAEASTFGFAWQW